MMDGETHKSRCCNSHCYITEDVYEDELTEAHVQEYWVCSKCGLICDVEYPGKKREPVKEKKSKK